MSGKASIPPWRKPPTDISVQALRELVAQFGPDLGVLVTWTHEGSTYQFVTVGADRFYADAAVRLRNEIAKNLHVNALGPTKEDLRGDHPNVSVTGEQVDFLLWLLGRVYAESDSMDAGKKQYVLKYHGQLLPILGQAKDTLKNQPV